MPSDFVNRVQLMMGKQRISQEAAAAQLGISGSFLARVLRGEQQPGAELCVHLARLEHLTPVAALALLRSCGHHSVAADLEALGFGGADVAFWERAHVEALRSLPEEEQEHWRSLVHISAERLRAGRTPAPQPRSTSAKALGSKAPKKRTRGKP